MIYAALFSWAPKTSDLRTELWQDISPWQPVDIALSWLRFAVGGYEGLSAQLRT